MDALVPDVVSDGITDAAKRLGISVDLVFVKAAKLAHYTDCSDHAQALKRLWMRSGEYALPHEIRDSILRILEGEHECPGVH